MFSSSEYQYIHDLIISYYNNGYKDYFCITNNPTNTSSNNLYDIYCYVSKDNINYSTNNFTISSGKFIKFDSNNRTDNNTIDKLVISDINKSTTVLADSKEFIYSNLGEYADITGTYRTSLNNHLDLNYAYLIPALLMLLFVFSFVKSCFRSRRS